MNGPSVYKNIWRMPIHIPFGDIDGGYISVDNGTVVIDYYGDGTNVDKFDDFDSSTISRILDDWNERRKMKLEG